MFGKKKKSEQAADAGDAPKVSRTGIILIVLSGLLVVATVITFGTMRARLLQSQRYAQRYARVCLIRPPAWVRGEWVDDVLVAAARTAKRRSVLDAALAKDVYGAVAAQPWVARVDRVTKYADGRVVVAAEFRRPFALVASPHADDPIVVDAEGYVLPLPASAVQQDAFVTIRDVAGKPAAPGRKWEAPDLADGLRLLKLLQGKPYVREITTVDVRNWNSRLSQFEPQLRLFAQGGQGGLTDIRFGRFPAADNLDYVVSPQEKLDRLDTYYKTHGRLAGANAYIDLRYDKLHVSVN